MAPALKRASLAGEEAAELAESADPTTEFLAPEVMARVRQIQIRTHRLVSEVLAGAYRSTLRGTGIEFEEVRPYLPGDDTRAIDWNVTARTGEPFIKTYREERQLTLFFLIDTSASMDFGSTRVTKREVAAEFSALLSFVAAQAKDSVGLCLFDTEPRLFLPPGQGPHHALRIVREVVAAPVRAMEAGTARADAEGPSPLAHAAEHLAKLLRRRALVFVVSDFLDGSLDGRTDEWRDALSRLGQRHDVIAVRVVDPLELELPVSGLIRLSQLEDGRELELDTRSVAVRRAWAAEARARDERLRDAFQRARVDRIELSTAGNVADPLIRFFQTRQRGAR